MKGYKYMKVSIVIPAYNEEKRIEKTVRSYYTYFLEKKYELAIDFELILVLNGCVDNTLGVIEGFLQEMAPHLIIIDLPQAGKGLALRSGFADALVRHETDLIGFVDADMATEPDAFFDLIGHLDGCDGVIASRYMPGAKISPARPLYKRWGSKIIYEPFVYMLFGLSYYDLQCGAKIFKWAVLQDINQYLTVDQWALDAELLYLCKKFDYVIKEVPTVWSDQVGSKLTVRAGLKMFSALWLVWRTHRSLQRK
jgi:glycosyltransferase involved in cell wall biosynthesis